MKITDTSIKGVFLIDPEKKIDRRGWFARLWNEKTVNISLSFNRKAGTLRGMHWQVPPHGEVKVVSCLKGEIYDVVMDLRKNSATYNKWYAVKLSAKNRRLIHIPKYCAHGFITLKPDTEVLYLISHQYYPESSRGIRWNDPTFNIRWPMKPRVISKRDKNYDNY